MRIRWLACLGFASCATTSSPDVSGIAEPPQPAGRLVPGETVLVARPGDAFAFDSGVSGRVYVWACSDAVDPDLEILDAQGRRVASDTDSGGGTCAFIELDVEAALPVHARVSWSGTTPEEPVQLHAELVCPTPESQALAIELEEAAAEISRLLAAGDQPAARASLQGIVSSLEGEEPNACDQRVVEAARRLMQQAAECSEDGAVLALAKLACDFEARCFPSDHPRLQADLQVQARALQNLGLLAEARRMQELVLESRQRTMPGDALELQTIRLDVGYACMQAGEFARADELLRSAIEALARTRAEDDRVLLNARLQLSSLISKSGRRAEAVALVEQVLETRTRSSGTSEIDLAYTRWVLAERLTESGEFERSLELKRQVFAEYERLLPPDSRMLLYARQNLGLGLKSLGRYEEARVHLEQAVAGLERCLEDDAYFLQIARGNLAATLYHLGEFERARELQERVVSNYARTRPEEFPEYLTQLQNLALTLKAQSDLARARALEERVLAIRLRTLPDHDPEVQRIRLNLSTTLGLDGELEEARALQQEAVNMLERELAPADPVLLMARTNLAITLNFLGEAQDARAIAESVIEVGSRSLDPDYPEIVRAKFALASALYIQREFAAARQLHEELLSLTERGIRFKDATEVALLRSLIHDCSAIGDRAGTIEYARRCSRAIQALINGAVISESLRELEAMLIGLDDNLHTLLSLPDGAGYFAELSELREEAFVSRQFFRAASLFNARAQRALASDPELEALRQELLRAGAAVARTARAADPGDAYLQALRAKDATQEVLLRRARKSGSFAGIPSLTPEAIARHLPPGTAAVEYAAFWRERKDESSPWYFSTTIGLLAFVLRADGELACVDLGDFSPIESAVESWRKSLRGVDAGALAARGEPVATSGGSAELDERSAGGELRAKIYDPLLPFLEGARSLILVPDGVLALIPFDALPFEEGRLGDRTDIEMRLALGEMQLPEAEIARRESLIAIGGIDFDSLPVHSGAVVLAGALEASPHMAATPRTTRPASAVRSPGEFFSDLPATRSEVLGIAALARGADLEQVLVIESSAASREALYELAAQAGILHLATHGYVMENAASLGEKPADLAPSASARPRVDQLTPLALCGLALAGANVRDSGGASEGLITAEEVAALDLGRCDLAVLSACDTGRGLGQAGLGIHSLQKAFRIAGARSVITSLWKVPDEATRDLMIEFYRLLLVEGRTKFAALSGAKRMLREARDANGAPRYSTRDWAGWVLVGSPD